MAAFWTFPLPTRLLSTYAEMRYQIKNSGDPGQWCTLPGHDRIEEEDEEEAEDVMVWSSERTEIA